MTSQSQAPVGRTRLFDATGRPYPGAGLPLPLPEHIRQELEREIIQGRLSAGERLAEEQLSKRLGVSRTPVREAMRMLEGQGLIVRRRARGTSVAERTTADQAHAIYHARFALEGHLAAAAATAIDDEGLAAVSRLQSEFADLAQSGARADQISADSDLHWAIYNSADSDLTSLVASYWGRLQRELYGRVYGSGPVEVYAMQHEQIVHALQQHDPIAARGAMVKHLEAGWQTVRRSYVLAAGIAESEGSDGLP
jgi:DNA-binding GntR family transcriptional regulator